MTDEVEKMTDEVEIPPQEQYQLQKLRVLTEVQDDLTAWAKRKMGLLVAALAIFGFFGAGGFISLTVGDRIEKEMNEVDARLLDSVKSIVESELSARQATKVAAEAAKTATLETARVIDAAAELRKVVESISTEAGEIEKKLKRQSKTMESWSANVREEARLLTNAIELRVRNLELLTGEIAKATGAVDEKTISQSVDRLKGEAQTERSEFVENSRFDLQITYQESSSHLVDKLERLLRADGYLTSRWTNFPEIEQVWGVPLSFLEGKVTILYPPGKKDVGERIARLIEARAGISGTKLAADRKPSSGFGVGLMIPPGFEP